MYMWIHMFSDTTLIKRLKTEQEENIEAHM